MTELLVIEKEVDIGRLSPCNIVFSDIKELSACHIKIIKTNENAILHMFGKNGGYINGRFFGQGEKTVLKYSDEISLFSIKVLWLDNVIAVNFENNIHYSKNNILTYKKPYEEISFNRITLSDNFNTSLTKHFFKKAPRTFYPVNDEAIELDLPPEKHIEDKQSLFMTIGPAFTMALPMAAGMIVSKMALKSSATSSAFIYTGLITAFCSAFLGVFWGLSNIKNKKMQLLINEQKRKAIYSKYVRESELKIKEQYNKKASNLRLTYPDVSEYVPDGINRFLLWNRSISDDDFLRIRIGLGNVPCNINIKIPKERFSLIEDELKNLPKMLKSKYSILTDVPETLDLMEEKYVGMVCDSIRTIEETFLSIITIIAVALSPLEVKIECCFMHETIRKEVLRAIRFLPHLVKNNNKRSENEYLIVFTDDYEAIKHSSDEKTFYFIASKRFEDLPSVCKFIIQRESFFSGYMKLSKNCSIRRDLHFDTVSIEEAEKIARLLQGVKIKSKTEEFVLPDKISYFELFEKKPDETEIKRRWEENDIRNEILCPVGVSKDGNEMILDLHEKGMGPHGLIAGMTGSGKSEILQTIILSLAINYSPEDVGFFLIDYKGGGMSKLFESLPHVLGSISNLSGRMIIRAMASVKSENERRQKLFIKTGVNNINQYKSISLTNDEIEPLPHIFIIIDEFAELKKEEPEFMKDLISVARVGRSLGVHLILATQKPTGVVDDNVLSNSRFRICLRLQDRMDSMEMLRRPDAADITNSGRAILQVGNDEIFTMFQGAYTMDKSDVKEKKKSFKLFDIGGREIEKFARYEEEIKDGEPQLNRVLFCINELYKGSKLREIRPLWLSPLKEEIMQTTDDAGRFNVPIGIYDNPRRQSQGEVILNLKEAGNILVLGNMQSGKSNLLSVLIGSLIINASEDDYIFYIIDYSSGALRAFKESHMCNGYICEENEEDIEKLFVLIEEIMDERRMLIKNSTSCLKLGEKCISDSDYHAPVILVIDGMQTFREHSCSKYDKELETLLRMSEGLSIYVFASANNLSTHEISRRMFECFKTCIPLGLKDKYEYKDALRLQGGDFQMPESVCGRGLTRINTDICEFQVYKAYDINEKLKIRSEALGESTKKRKRRPIPVIPKNLNLSLFIDELSLRNEEIKGIPVGFFLRSGKVFYLPYEDEFTVLISGRKGSGKSNLIEVIRYMSHYMNIPVEENDMDICDIHECSLKIEYVGYKNGMKVYVYDEKLPFETQKKIKEKAGEDAYLIHLGGALDRQNVADFSYIPYSKQVEIHESGFAVVRKTVKGFDYGEVVIPKVI